MITRVASFFDVPLDRSWIHHQAFDIRAITCSHPRCEMLAFKI
jgi:hypothetical protein